MGFWVGVIVLWGVAIGFGFFPDDEEWCVLQAYLTHRYQVAGLRGIVTETSRLESTTLVFAYGLDLFYIRTAPSRMYDSLTEDFSYSLLLLTVVALVVAILVAWVLADRKEVQMKWK